MAQSSVVEILIDASGSMGQMKGGGNLEGHYLINGQARMTLVKYLLLDHIIPTIDYCSQIFIRTFRTEVEIKNSQVLQKAVETPLIYSGTYVKDALRTAINKLEAPPMGGTPITAAIHSAIGDLEKFSSADRKIILLTDGEENGPGDFRAAAKKALELQGIPCKIFIIGIALDPNSEQKAKEIATGGYVNITSNVFTGVELKKVLTPLKIVTLQNTIQNISAAQAPIPAAKPQNDNAAKAEQKLREIKQENNTAALSYFDEIEGKIKQQINNNQALLSEVLSLKEQFRINDLIASGIAATTLTIDEEYSESIRQKSETFLFGVLKSKYGASKVKWVNEAGESFKHYDFEIIDEKGDAMSFIECKGTPQNKLTFYLTAEEWKFFLQQKESYSVYRAFNVEGNMRALEVGNLFQALIGLEVVPYLSRPEILREGRVFLTLTKA